MLTFPGAGIMEFIAIPIFTSHKEADVMRFVKVQDEERSGQVAINLDLVREAHFGGGLLHLYFERSATSQDDATFTGDNATKLWAAMS
jgi:hypothetical protein